MTKGGKRLGHSKFGWEFFGAELKRRREDAGLTQQDLGNRAFCSGSYIGQFESAIRKPQLDLAQRFDEVLGAGGLFERMWRELINKEPVAEHYREAAELTKRAETLSWYAPQLVPGPLQTEEYAREIFRSCRPFESDEEIEELVQNRIERGQGVLEGSTVPQMWAILDEAVLRRQVGASAAMAKQLRHIAEVAEKHRVLVQVLPFSFGAHALMEGHVTLMTFEEEPPVAYTEGVWTGRLQDDPATVARCQAAYDLVRAAALSPEASLAMVKSLVKEYEDAP
ncbi:helix-turn-helix domain-containing protein [Streptomyces gobiensis]|uniref:helix-turn-helix domain-containing protein n=1 Tax=Streptomyces gobiensis TaxID=2875706 RepID=UPI001E2AD579|nr:helix-turn-helix transcriptional regulator [Streptomyces gobiensis]UGY92378.1 helix-turn-helix transcriptional regulator [Streptomyces gobiensis]